MNRFLLPVLALAPLWFFEPDKGGGGGGAGATTEKPPSIDAQLTTSQARVTELEGQLATANGSVTTLTTERDNARRQATTFQEQHTTAQQEVTRLGARVTEVEGLLATANTNVSTLTRERDDARTSYADLLANPSAQARQILAQAGGAPVEMRPGGKAEASDTGKTTPAAGLTGLKAATAKMAAADKKAS